MNKEFVTVNDFDKEGERRIGSLIAVPYTLLGDGIFHINREANIISTMWSANWIPSDAPMLNEIVVPNNKTGLLFPFSLS